MSFDKSQKLLKLNQKQNTHFQYAMLLCSQAANFQDAMIATTTRDIQVFDQSFYDSHFGASHLAFTGPFFGVGTVFTIVYALAKVFYPKQTNTLHQVLQNLKNEGGFNYFKPDGS